MELLLPLFQILQVCFEARQFARQCFQQLYQLRLRKFQPYCINNDH